MRRRLLWHRLRRQPMTVKYLQRPPHQLCSSSDIGIKYRALAAMGDVSPQDADSICLTIECCIIYNNIVPISALAAGIAADALAAR